MEKQDILQINSTLNPNIWKNNELDPEVSEQLIKIARDFFEDLSLEGIEIEDITFTGSLANYNWTKYSDIDLHIIVDFSKIDENYDLVREYFNAKTSLWNKMHQIMINDFEIELYVQDISEKHHSTGVYSIMNNEWIATPQKVSPKVDTDMVKRKISSFIDMIERVEDSYEEQDYKEAYERAINLASRIKKYRKSGLEDKGEYSTENLVFKYLRNKEFIKKLYDTRNSSYDKMMSIIGNYDKKFKIFVKNGPKKKNKGFIRLEELEKFQKKVKRRHMRAKKWFLSKGGQKTGIAYPHKPNYKRSKSAPVGFGGT
jgi:predicted nucleotidyltransferase